LNSDEFCIPYVFHHYDADYSDVPHLTKVLLRYKHQIEAMRGSWFDVDAVMKPGDESTFDEDPERRWVIALPRRTGGEADDQKAPRKILWYEGWAELPNQTKSGTSRRLWITGRSMCSG